MDKRSKLTAEGMALVHARNQPPIRINKEWLVTDGEVTIISADYEQRLQKAEEEAKNFAPFGKDMVGCSDYGKVTGDFALKCGISVADATQIRMSLEERSIVEDPNKPLRNKILFK